MHPETKQPCKIPEDGWRFATKEEMQRQIDLRLVALSRGPYETAISKSTSTAKLPDERKLRGNGGDESTSSDAEDEEVGGLQVMPSLIQKQAQVAIKLLKKVFGGKKVFDNPKDHDVIARLVRYVTNSNDIILDSFAGSGTLGHAVLQINSDDRKSKRRFVLVELDQKIATEVTRQRLKFAVERIPEVGKRSGSGFRYCRLGRTLLDANGNINGAVPFPDLGRYVYLLATGVPAPKQPRKDCPLLGVHHGQAIYLLYNGVLGDRHSAGGNVLTRAVLADLPPHPDGRGPRVVYGEACRLGEATLHREGVTFRQIPYTLRD